MIVKSKARRTSSFKQLIEYMFSDKGRNEGSPDFVITQNVKGETIDGWVSQMEENEGHRIRKAKNDTKVLHEILSFHVNDKSQITTEKLKRITEEYIQMRSPIGMFVAVPHTEDGHVHVHICGSPLEYMSGKSLRMSRKEFQALKAAIQKFQFETYPELTHSIVDHGRKKEPRMIDARAHASHMTDLNLLTLWVKDCVRLQQPTEVILAALEEQGCTVYHRSGKDAGVVYNGRKYRLKRIGLDPTSGIDESLNKSHIPELK